MPQSNWATTTTEACPLWSLSFTTRESEQCNGRCCMMPPRSCVLQLTPGTVKNINIHFKKNPMWDFLVFSFLATPVAGWILIPWLLIDAGPRQWQHRDLTTGLPGNGWELSFCFLYEMFKPLTATVIDDFFLFLKLETQLFL